MSQAVPSVRRGAEELRTWRRSSSMRGATIGVYTRPGAMQLVRIPSGPWSAAMEMVRPITAALDAVYGVLLWARRPAMEEMLMMDPPPTSIMRGMANLLHMTMVFTFTAMMWSQSSSDTSTTVPRREMPTLLSRMSSRPYRSMQASTIRSQSAARVTSACTVDATPPSAWIISIVSAARSSVMSTSRTFAPSRANSVAVARPLPTPGPLEPAPVTIATFPSSRGLRSGTV